MKDKKCILIVEDNLINSRLMAEYLKRKGICFVIAHDGESAVNEVRNNPSISLVLMDIGLPYMSGDEAMGQIKKIKPGLPVIAQTAYTFSDSEEDYIKSGFDDYIPKPINFYNLDKLLYKYDCVSVF